MGIGATHIICIFVFFLANCTAWLQDLVVIDVLPQMVALSESYFQVYQCQQQQRPAAAAKQKAAKPKQQQAAGKGS
jgi:hypothetical protein